MARYAIIEVLPVSLRLSDSLAVLSCVESLLELLWPEYRLLDAEENSGSLDADPDECRPPGTFCLS